MCSLANLGLGITHVSVRTPWNGNIWDLGTRFKDLLLYYVVRLVLLRILQSFSVFPFG